MRYVFSFIYLLFKNISQIMENYEELIHARSSKNPAYNIQLLELEKQRNYKKQMIQLESLIQEHELQIQTLRDSLNGLGNKYNPQV